MRISIKFYCFARIEDKSIKKLPAAQKNDTEKKHQNWKKSIKKSIKINSHEKRSKTKKQLEAHKKH